MEANTCAASEASDRQTAVADEVINRRDEFCQRRADSGASDLRQNCVEGRALPVASDENLNIVLIETVIASRPTPFSRLA